MSQQFAHNHGHISSEILPETTLVLVKLLNQQVHNRYILNRNAESKTVAHSGFNVNLKLALTQPCTMRLASQGSNLFNSS